MNSKTKSLLCWSGLFCLLSIANITSSRELDEDLLTLIQLMETNISTKTDLQDPDRAPGQVTVLEGGELRARGYRIVSEALHHVAGFDITKDSRGIPTPSVRGIGGIRSGASGKVKTLINGTEAYTVLSSTADLVLNLPINFIDKIEIIRGPGSVIHGENAYSAVVNVITRSDDTEISLNNGSHKSAGIDGLFSKVFDNGIVWDIAASLYNSDGADIIVESDSLFNLGQQDISFAPGTSNELEKNRFIRSILAYQDFSISMHWNSRKTGDFYGLGGSLPPPENGVRRDNEVWYIEARYQTQFNKHTDFNIKAGYQDYQTNFQDITTQPPGYRFDIPPIPAFQFPGLTVVYPDGILVGNAFDERRIKLSTDLAYRGFKKHRLFFGIDASKNEGYNSTASVNLDLANPNPILAILPTPEIEQYPGALGTIPEGNKRDILSIYAQDEFNVTEQLWITTGIRYDHYSDVGSEVVPRIAAVYESGAHNIIKAQYAEAFRPPTYAELFSVAQVSLGNPDIKPEEVQTIELAWIHKRDNAIFRANLFHSNLDSLIVLSPNAAGSLQFGNTGGATTRGLELEAELSLNRSFRIDSNLTYSKTKDDLTGQDLEGASDFISNINFIWQPASDLSLNVHYRYQGKRHRSPVDSRTKLGSYQSVDLSLNFFNFVDTGVQLSIEANNLLDEDIRFPSTVGTYPDDFPQDDRALRIKLSKTFK